MIPIIRYLVPKHDLVGWDGTLHAGVRVKGDVRLVDWIGPWPDPFVGLAHGCPLDMDAAMPGTYLCGPCESIVIPPGQDFDLVAEDKGDFVEIVMYRKDVAECCDEPCIVCPRGLQ